MWSVLGVFGEMGVRTEKAEVSSDCSASYRLDNVLLIVAAEEVATHR